METTIMGYIGVIEVGINIGSFHVRLQPWSADGPVCMEIYQNLPCTLNWGYMVPNSGYLSPNRG